MMNLHDTIEPKKVQTPVYPSEGDTKKLEPKAPTPDPITKVKPQADTTEL
jgi:hypothetical protein